MSVHVLSWVLRNSPEKLGRRLVLLVLADHAREDGSGAWPSVETIAREARMTRRPVQEALRGLEASGAIAATGKTKQGVAIYSVLMGGADSAPRVGGGGADDDVEGALLPTEGGAATAPEPSLEDPSLEPSLPPGDSQTLVAEYVDLVRELGADPPKRVKGTVGKRIKGLLDEGQSPDAIREALRLMVERRLHPASLDSLMIEAVLGPPRLRPVSDIDDDLRRLAT